MSFAHWKKFSNNAMPKTHRNRDDDISKLEKSKNSVFYAPLGIFI